MKTQTIPHKYQFKRGRSGAFDESTLLLEAGEPFIEYREDKTVVGMKIGDGVNYYNDLPFLDQRTQELLLELKAEVKTLQNQVSDAGDYSYFVDLNEWESDTTADLQRKITQIIQYSYPEATPTLGNLFIVKGPLIGGSKFNLHQVFVLTEEGWQQIVGSEMRADKIILTDNIRYTEPVGRYDVPASGSGTISCKGWTLEQLLSDILCYKRDPEVTEPTVTLKVNKVGEVLAGETATVSYETKLNKGSYQYGPETGAKLTSVKVQLLENGIEVDSSTEAKGTFTVEVKEHTVYSIASECTVSVDNRPYNNMGEQVTPVGFWTSKKFTDEKYDIITAVAPTVYYSGGKGADEMLDLSNPSGSDLVSALHPSFTRPDTIHGDFMQQLIIAIPASEAVQVVCIRNGWLTAAELEYNDPQSCFQCDLPVNNKTIRYNIFYLQNEIPDRGSNTYTIEYT